MLAGGVETLRVHCTYYTIIHHIYTIRPDRRRRIKYRLNTRRAGKQRKSLARVERKFNLICQSFNPSIHYYVLCTIYTRLYLPNRTSRECHQSLEHCTVYILTCLPHLRPPHEVVESNFVACRVLCCIVPAHSVFVIPTLAVYTGVCEFLKSQRFDL